MKNLKLSTLYIIMMFACVSAFAQNTKNETFKNFYVKPYAGFIGIQNMDLQLAEGNQTTNITVENGFGFATGISLGYNFSKNITAEVGWEYKSNEVSITNNGIKSNGDYASNFIYLNGIYNFNTTGKLTPYVGLGASLIQEIDFDFGMGENTSFSDSGNIGLQGIAGLDYNFSEKWALNWEAKYATFSEFDMKNEANNNKLNNLKYNPFIFNIGVKYRF